MSPRKWGRIILGARHGGDDVDADVPSSSSSSLPPPPPCRLVPPSQPSRWYHRSAAAAADVATEPASSQCPPIPTAAASTTTSQHLSQHPSVSTVGGGRLLLPSSAPSVGTSAGLGKLRRVRREEVDSSDASDSLLMATTTSSSSSSGGSPRFRQHGHHLDRSTSFPSMKRSRSNPFLQKPLHLSSSSSGGESSPLLQRIMFESRQNFGSMMPSERGGNSSQSSSFPDASAAKERERSSCTPPVATRGHVVRHLSLPDLIAVGVGGTLGTGFFLLCSLLASSYAGPSSIGCWLLGAVPALLSGLCFAELAGQIPAAGSTYAYVYASMGELPAVVAAGCLSLEYLASAGAVARGWGDNVVEWILATKPGVDDDDDDGWASHILRPGWNFNPMAFVLSALVSMLLLGGVKESKAITNYFTAFKTIGILLITLTGLYHLEVQNLTPFLPRTLGWSGFFRGGTISFMGFLGFDEVCCLTAEAIEPQKNMPRAIMCTIAILTVCYMAGTLALSGMLPYDQISSIGGFRDAFEARGVEWASTMASVGELVFLPLVVLVALMAQPRLTFALACDGLMPPWFGQVDDSGNMWNGTLFAGGLMTLIASFVRLQYLNDFISAGVLVAFSMTNSSLILLKHESPDDSPGLLEKLLFGFNVICFSSSLLISHTCTSTIGKLLTGTSCLLAILTCILIKRWCPAAPCFGGKTRRATTQHMTVGIVSVDDEYFRTPLVPYVPCLGIAVNCYLIAQLPWTDLAFLVVFLSCAVIFYFSFGYYFSVGNNGGWDAYESCGLSIVLSEVDSVHGLPID